MTKPRFTPDPLPDGLDPSLASFLQRQFDRMNDWWPKDLEDRVKALEKSYPYIGGTWPIVDYSTIEFNGSATAQQLFQPKRFIYHSTGGAANITESDYNSFDTLSAPVLGLGISYNVMLDNGAGQAVAYEYGIGDMRIYRSADGINWASANPASMFNMAGIVWHKDRWVMVGAVTSPSGEGFVCLSSPDLVNFTTEFTTTSRTIEPSQGHHRLASNGERLVMSARNVFTGPRIAVSDDDGKTWSHYASPDAEDSGPIFYANGLFFFTTFKRKLYTSPTGLSGSWTKRLDLGTINWMIQLAYGGGRYMLVPGNYGAVLSSTDGFNWSSVLSTQNVDGPWPLSYDEEYGWLFAAVDTIQHSPDGINWSLTNLGSNPGFSARGSFRMNIPT